MSAEVWGDVIHCIQISAFKKRHVTSFMTTILTMKFLCADAKRPISNASRIIVDSRFSFTIFYVDSIIIKCIAKRMRHLQAIDRDLESYNNILHSTALYLYNIIIYYTYIILYDIIKTNI